MKLRWYPKNVLAAVVLLAACGFALDLAVDFKSGATVGVLALIAYLSAETVLTFNPAQWRRGRSGRS
jgi:hypothetical protein